MAASHPSTMASSASPHGSTQLSRKYVLTYPTLARALSVSRNVTRHLKIEPAIDLWVNGARR